MRYAKIILYGILEIIGDYMKNKKHHHAPGCQCPRCVCKRKDDFSNPHLNADYYRTESAIVSRVSIEYSSVWLVHYRIIPNNPKYKQEQSNGTMPLRIWNQSVDKWKAHWNNMKNSGVTGK